MPTHQEVAERQTEDTKALDAIDPDRIRVVDLETEGEVIRQDCYDPGNEKKMFRLQEGEVQLRTLQWDRTKSMDPEIRVEWTDTGMSPHEVEQVRIFDWPMGDLIRVYKEVE